MEKTKLIEVKVKIHSKNPGVEFQDGKYIVGVTSIPENGKANLEVEKRLADFLDLPKSSVHVVKGHKSRVKTVSATYLS